MTTGGQAMPKTRAELIASFKYGSPDDAPKTSLAVGAGDGSPPPAAGGDDPSADAPSEDNAGDNPVTEAIAKVKAAVAALQGAQAEDPDQATDPDDKPVNDDIDALMGLIEDLEKAQAKDVANDAEAPEPVTAAGSEGTATGAPEDLDSLVDTNGNVDPSAKCHTAGCDHLASAHEDLDTGANSGHCNMMGCECPGISLGTKPLVGGDDASDDPADGAADAGTTMQEEGLSAALVGEDAPVAAPAEGSTGPVSGLAPSDSNPPPQVEGSALMGPAFTIPVGLILGQDTGDGRGLALDSTDWRTPPLPLMGMDTATHDPGGMDQNDPAVLCGRIDSLEIVPGENGTQIVTAKGFYLPNEDGERFAQQTDSMGRCGISADVAVKEQEVTGELDEDGWPTVSAMVVTQGTIMGFTQVPHPAFEGCYIVLGDGSVQPEAIPQQDENQAPVTASVHFLTYEECEPCAQGIDIIVAAGGPLAPPKAWFENPNFTVGDGRLMELAEVRGNRRLGGSYACPITVDDDGRIFGHLAPWGVCHTGTTGQCIMAPRSKDNYAHFMRGQHVITAEGEKVRVGTITAGAGHASIRSGAGAAMAHYDNTALQVADVTVGEDDFGIWVAGALRPDATEEQVRMLRASSLSGDWRNMGGGLELVAALCVNQPGFPLAVVAGGGRVESLVASGAGAMHKLAQPDAVISAPEGDTVLRAALAPLLGQAKGVARSRIDALR